MLSNKKSGFEFASLATQFLLSIGAALYAGLWLDKKIHTPFPLLVWVLPLITIVAVLYKIINDTSTKK